MSEFAVAVSHYRLKSLTLAANNEVERIRKLSERLREIIEDAVHAGECPSGWFEMPP
jgi:hypothetical protein